VSHARADESAESFYKGVHEMKMVIGAGPAGAYDLFGRLLARHIGNHIPGHPTITPVNMPGASGIKAANWVAYQGPQDGTIISNVRYTFATDQALDNLPEMKIDIRDFHWLGSFNATNHVFVVSNKAPVRTFDDLRKTQVVIGEATPSSNGTLLCKIYNLMLGTKIKVITGYRDSAKVKLAVEQGEVQGLGDDGWSDLKSDFPDMIAKHQLSVLVQLGLKKEPDLPNVPRLIDVAQNPAQKAVLEFITKGTASMGKPFATSPGVPADRVALLRAAFGAMMKDTAFLADAEKLHVPIDPISGEDVQKLIADVRGAPKSVTDPVRHDLGLDAKKAKVKKEG
jgi:tripartite-type tricarboxylate transporter receptor subunit TctC